MFGEIFKMSIIDFWNGFVINFFVDLLLELFRIEVNKIGVMIRSLMWLLKIFFEGYYIDGD